MSRRMRHVAFAHPPLSELRRRHQVWTSSVLPITERWFGV